MVPKLVLAVLVTPTLSFLPPNPTTRRTQLGLTPTIANLKSTLKREYATFFSPMYPEFYSPGVTFSDPLTSLTGVDAYRDNVDLLAGRNLLGKILFEDAGIVLHTISGGEPKETGGNEDLVTRWTLRVTVKVIPWKPTARFTGVSVYRLDEGRVEDQLDYWDSINIHPNRNGAYRRVSKKEALGDFLNQLKPGGLQAVAAGQEVPYQLLRRGNGYEVRRYPEMATVGLPYARRDEGFGSLGSFTRGMKPFSPAVMTVPSDDTRNKIMSWVVSFSTPTEPFQIPKDATDRAGEGQWRTVFVKTVPEKVVAVLEFNDASMGPVVRRADRELRDLLERDGLRPAQGTKDGVRFAQYDAVYSMGKRKGEVWIDLDPNGHPY